jgi:hypothetical protein
MAARIAQQLAAAADLLRPGTFFRTLARVDQVSDKTRALEQTVETLRLRTEQLEAITRLDWELQDEVAKLAQYLEPARIEAHISAAVAAAPIVDDPFPHIVVERWLPPDVYRTIVRALPPAIFFTEKEISRQRLLVPFSFAPTYSRRVWAFVADHIVAGVLRRALEQKFESSIAAFVRTAAGDAAASEPLELRTSDGRIMLRRPGYVIPPHRDQRWGFVTGLVYLAREGDAEEYGTRLYRVDSDEDAPTDKPFYIDESRCQPVKTVPFRANTLFAFLNSTGAHGASIPADAQPADLERYVYQFRLGPSAQAIQRLLAAMPPERRIRWAGAKALKAERSS